MFGAPWSMRHRSVGRHPHEMVWVELGDVVKKRRGCDRDSWRGRGGALALALALARERGVVSGVEGVREGASGDGV